MLLIPSPDETGWVLESNPLKPVLITKPEAEIICKELIRCNCQSKNGFRHYKCNKLGLACTESCKCFCSLQKNKS